MDAAAIIELVAAGWARAVGEVSALKDDMVWACADQEGRRYVVKNWGTKDAGFTERVEFFQAVAEHVRARGVAIETKLRTAGGGWVHHQGMHGWTLAMRLPDQEAARTPDEGHRLIWAYGEAIARMHAALATYPLEDARRRTWRLDVLGEAASAWDFLRREQPQLHARLGGILDDVERRVLAPLRGVPEQLIVYDCHHGNLLHRHDRVTGFIDYDHLSIGMRIFDLANFLSQDVLLRMSAAEIAGWRPYALRVLSGYRSQQPLDAGGMRALWACMVAMRLIELKRDLPRPGARAARLADEIEFIQRVADLFGA